MKRLVVLLLLLLEACSCSNVVGVEGSDSGVGLDASLDAGPAPDAPGLDAPIVVPGLRALRIDPATATITDDGVAPGETASFRALGMFDDGERDLTSMVTWTIADESLATLAGGVATSRQRGGRSTVTATAGALAADATLTVVLEAVVVDEGAPATAPSLFPADTAGDLDGDAVDLRVVYPSDGTMFPRNLAPVNHQWRAEASLDLFELRFDSDVAHVRFYTTERALQPGAAAWEWLASTHAGSSTTMSVRGLATAMPTTIYASQRITELYSGSEVLGALYYWSTGAAGVMRAHVSAATATRFYTDPESGDDTCVSCHTVSRDGRRMAVAYGGERLRTVTIPDRELRIPASESERGPDYGWGTFNPGATRLLYAHRGVLHLLDVEAGVELSTVALPAMQFATHPDWSPDGRFVAVALATGRAPGNKEVTGSSLARIPVLDGDAFGTPEILVASTSAEDTIYFPSYSPDSRYLAFVRGVGGSKDNDTSRLYLLPAGGGTPIDMTLLNERVRDEDGIDMIGNSMPTWAPSTRPEIFWLAFSSLRDYGDVLVGTDRDQLWGAAIDPARAAVGSDPSFAAFWFPFQDLAEGNHRAFWALASEDECPSTIEICDSLDNDCDGIVDEMCCMPEMEVCGDGRDNDCDGTADEACGCMPEVCDNGRDDDCDMLVDEMDEDCIVL